MEEKILDDATLEEATFEGAPLAAQARLLLQDGDSYRVAEMVQAHGNTAEIAARYDALTRDLYWKAKDLAAVAVVARAGILYCLGQALRADPGEGDVIDGLRSTAKRLAFNLGSFTWPGWDEPGIIIGLDDLVVGMDAARLNLRLAGELGKPAAAHGAAHWLLGAHLLAAGAFPEATEQFSAARAIAVEQDNKPGVLLETGYCGLARIAGGQDAPRGERDLQEALAGLKLLNTEEGAGFVEQLQAARRAFVS